MAVREIADELRLDVGAGVYRPIFSADCSPVFSRYRLTLSPFYVFHFFSRCDLASAHSNRSPPLSFGPPVVQCGGSHLLRAADLRCVSGAIHCCDPRFGYRFRDESICAPSMAKCVSIIESLFRPQNKTNPNFVLNTSEIPVLESKNVKISLSAHPFFLERALSIVDLSSG
jgi:hypothetical protein